MYNLLNISNEDFENEDDYIADGDEVIEEIANEDESTLALTNEVTEEGEMDVLDDRIAAVSDEVDSLESIANILQHSLENNKPLDKLSAAVMSNHLHAISRTTGLEFYQHSVEDFEDATNAKRVTQDSIESFKEKAQMAWDWVVKQVMKLVDFVKNFFSSATIAYKRMKANAESLKGKIKDIEFKEVGEIEKFGDRLYLMKPTGGLISWSGISKVAGNSATSTRIARNTKLADVYKKFADDLSKGITVEQRNNLLKEIRDSFTAAANEMGWSMTGNNYSPKGEYTGPKIAVVIDWETQKVTTDVADTKSDDSLKVVALNKAEMENALKSLTDSIDDASASFKSNISSRFDGVLRGVKVPKPAKGEDGKEVMTKEEARRGQSTLVTVNRAYNNMVTLAGRQHVNTCKAVTKLVAKSIAFHGGEGGKKDDDGKKAA